MPKRKETKIDLWLKSSLEHFKRSIYPEAYVCHFCGAELNEEDREDSLCPKCRARLPYRHENVCPVCGEYVNSPGLCSKCRKSTPPFVKAYSAFDYKGAIQRMIINYKEECSPWLGPYIAKYLTSYAKAMDITADYLTYVPSSAFAVKRRGFEPNRKVAVLLSNSIGIPLTEPLCRKIQKKDQKELNAEQRFDNVAHAFAMKEEYDRSILIGKRVLLIDDVMTTGATVTACARILKANGAKEIIILTLARS